LNKNVHYEVEDSEPRGKQNKDSKSLDNKDTDVTKVLKLV